jgi:hypothetical protein
LASIGSGDELLGTMAEEDSGTAIDLGAGAGAGTGSGVAAGRGVGSGAAIGGPDSFDGPVGSGMDSAASRAGDSATGLGMTCSGPEFESSLRESVDDLAGVGGLAKPPVRAVDDRFIMVPMRDRRDFVEGDD